MKSFQVQNKDSGIRLSRFLEKQTPALTLSAMYKAIRTKHIKVNGKRTEASYRLQENDVVEVWLEDEMLGVPARERRPDFLKASKDISVIYEDNHIAIMDKPEGLYSHPVKGEYSDTMVSRFLRYLYEKGEYHFEDSFVPALCNRLDRNTSGLLVAAKDHESVEEINRLIRERKLEKTYFAVCVGTVELDGIFTAYLKKDEKRNIVTVSDREIPGSSQIITEFHPIRRKNGLTLMRAILHTGKTHQIRAHLSHLGFPILGDTKYGNTNANKKWKRSHQCLVSKELIFHTEKDSLFSYLDGRIFSTPGDPFSDLL